MNNLKMSAALVVAFAAAGGAAQGASVFVENEKLLAADGAVYDRFGVSVAISGTTAIVGAGLDDDKGGDSGSAYLFDVTTGTQIAKLTASDGAAGDRFATSVAISGATAIVSAVLDDDKGDDSGSAYLFDVTTGTQIAKLTASDGAAGDLFGSPVAISGTTAIIGARYDDDKGSNSGSAYLFDVTTGTQLAKLTASDGAAGDRFGNSVAISGTTAIVGAPYDDDKGGDSGSAYLFDMTTGSQIAKLTASDGAAGDAFGGSVAISGTIAIVGAGDKDGYRGAAYLFDATTGTQIAKLAVRDGAPYERFGGSVAISGATAIVGARGDNDNGRISGAAYLFDASTGTQIGKLTASDGAARDLFGFVAISGTTAIVGADQPRLFYSNGNVAHYGGNGSAYVYRIDALVPDPDWKRVTPRVVPLPAAAWLLVSGVAALGVLRRLGGRA